MDKIQKLLNKISKKDRIQIEKILLLLFSRNFKELKIKKLKGFKYIFRVRTGDFRIIYFDDGNEIILKAIKKRNESTYSDF